MLDADNIKIIQIHTIAANSFDMTQGFVCLFIYLLFLIGLCIFVRSSPFLLSLLWPSPVPQVSLSHWPLPGYSSLLDEDCWPAPCSVSFESDPRNEPSLRQGTSKFNK